MIGRRGMPQSRRSLPAKGAGGGGAFVPTSVAGMTLWLKADVGITLNGSNVSGWADQSGAGNNATQVQVVKQPAFVASSINGLPAVAMGKPAADFNFVDLPGTLATYLAGTAYTILVVSKPSSTVAVANGEQMDGLFGGNTGYFQVGYATIATVPTACVNTYDGLDKGATAVPVTLGAAHQFIAYCTGGTSTIQVGSNTPGTVAAGAIQLLTDTVSIGGGFTYTHPAFTNVAEILIYNNYVGATNLGLLKTYLTGRYAV